VIRKRVNGGISERGAAASAGPRTASDVFEAPDFVENSIRKNAPTTRNIGADFLHVAQFP
jgi:hypothetical protein